MRFVDVVHLLDLVAAGEIRRRPVGRERQCEFIAGGDDARREDLRRRGLVGASGMNSAEETQRENNQRTQTREENVCWKHAVRILQLSDVSHQLP
jgi:hypothetical protein